VKEGDNEIVRNTSENPHPTKDFDTVWTVYENLMKAVDGQGKFYVDPQQRMDAFPRRLLLPKGKYLKKFLVTQL
jgi:hypothetical protein